MNGNYRDEYTSDDSHPVAAGLLGAVAGAVVGIAIANILADPQKRKIVGRQLQDMQKWGNIALKEIKDRSAMVGDAKEERVTRAQKKAESIKDDLESNSAKVK